MTYVLERDGDVTNILMDFTDEGVDLQVSRKVAGDEAKAADYVKVLEADARRDFADKFPPPPVEDHPEEEME